MDQTKPIPEDIKKFLESILDEAGMQSLDEETRNGMIHELFYQLDNYLAGVIVDNLPSDALDTFVKLNQEKKPKEEIEGFIKEKLPNAQEVFTKAFADFKQLYLENVTAEKARDKDQDQT